MKTTILLASLVLTLLTVSPVEADQTQQRKPIEFTIAPARWTSEKDPHLVLTLTWRAIAGPVEYDTYTLDYSYRINNGPWVKYGRIKWRHPFMERDVVTLDANHPYSHAFYVPKENLIRIDSIQVRVESIEVLDPSKLSSLYGWTQNGISRYRNAWRGILISPVLVFKE